MMMYNDKTIQFKEVDQNLLEKTTYSEKGIINLFKSMSSEFVLSEKSDFLVRPIKEGNVFHILSHKIGEDITVELKDIYEADFYENSGVVTKNITKKQTLN